MNFTLELMDDPIILYNTSNLILLVILKYMEFIIHLILRKLNEKKIKKLYIYLSIQLDLNKPLKPS